MTHSKPILTINNLTVDFLSEGDPVRAVDNVSFNVCPGETLVILGESGSGKSVSTGTVMGLIDCPPGDIVAGSLVFDGNDISRLSNEHRRKLNGQRIAMIFQDPLAYLNPVFTVGRQIAEVFEAHGEAQTATVRDEVIRLLERVGIPDAKDRIDYYPHQFSGGQRQRVMIAMAIALKPDILIADEPTTALDVSVQAQILELLREINRKLHITILLITHEMDVVKSICHEVAIIGGGELVEKGTVGDIFAHPKTELAHQFIRSTLDLTIPEDYQARLQETRVDGSYPLVPLEFTGATVDAPLMTQIARKFNIDVSILSSDLDYAGGVKFGMMVAELFGNESDDNAAIQFLRDNNVKVEVLGYVL